VKDSNAPIVEEPTPVETAQTDEVPEAITKQVPMMVIPLPAGTDFTITHLEDGGRRILIGPLMVGFTADFDDAESCRAFAREMSGGIEIASSLDDATRAQADRLARKGHS
jgi:hypothetical protein